MGVLLLGQSHRHSTSQKMSVLRCKFLGFLIARSKSRQTGTLTIDSMTKELGKKNHNLSSNKTTIYISMYSNADFNKQSQKAGEETAVCLIFFPFPPIGPAILHYIWSPLN